ncbi:NUDIX hydrolase [Streptomyces sp. NPDC048669]|uniref:NUDIX hydrolase n=1 Tax=Streptomyces sp. NPDC048669 TaxID=3155267 RepID=UPI003417DBB3
MTDTETPETIRYTADIVCIRDGNILLIERGWDPHAGMLALPGGHVDPGETALAAAARELGEEAGIQVNADDLNLIGFWDAPDRDPRGRYITAAYTVTVPDGTTAKPGTDAVAVHWVPLNDIPPPAFDHNDIVTAAISSH